MPLYKVYEKRASDFYDMAYQTTCNERYCSLTRQGDIANAWFCFCYFMKGS